MLVTNQFPNSWLGHFLQYKLSNACMTKEMCMQRKTTLFCIIVYCMLQGIDGALGFVRRFVRYGKGNKFISRLYDLDLTPTVFSAKKPSVFNLLLSTIQYVSLSWGYRAREGDEITKG